MATFLPARPEQRPDFTTHSPPDHALLYANGTLQQSVRAYDNVHDSNDLRTDYRRSLDFPPNVTPMAPNGNGGLPMPKGPSHLPTNGRNRNTMSMGAFEGPRSPPNAKNTAQYADSESFFPLWRYDLERQDIDRELWLLIHVFVPCKFFRLGQCQAGKACPFSHTLDNSGDEICRYFQKGNCKFGQKCALAHVLPNGRRVNRPNGPSRGSMDLGGRIDPQLYRQSDPALAHSLLAQQANGGASPFSQQIPSYAESEHTLQIPRPQAYDTVPSIDTEYASPQYGSPTDGSRTAFSPSGHLNVLDAPLPASFDSQGISYIARHGPVAASVPSKFGLEFSSPPSSHPQKVVAPSDSINALQSSLAARRNPRSKVADLGSSPLTSGDEGPPHRVMHSQRIAKPKTLSASLPRVGMHADDWDDGFHFSEGEETDYIPTSLHDQILTPQEKMRRMSRNDQDSRSVRESLSGIGTPGESSSKVGSPNTGSPSRYGAFFARKQQDNAGGNTSSSPSAFGPVGSPLRNLHPGASPSMRASSETGDLPPSFPAFASPPRQSSMSILSQQLSRTRITSRPSEGGDGLSGNLHPNSARHSSAPTATYSRALSTSANRGRIEEEQGEAVFSMEEEEDERLRRHSGNPNHNAWGAIGSGRGADWT